MREYQLSIYLCFATLNAIAFMPTPEEISKVAAKVTTNTKAEVTATPAPAIKTEAVPQPKAESKPTSSPAIATPRYPTEFYRKAGIPYCSTCGESYRTNTDGTPLCPVAKPAKECPRLQ